MGLEGSALSGASVLYPPLKTQGSSWGLGTEGPWEAEAVQGSCETLLSECDKAVTGTTSQWV